MIQCSYQRSSQWILRTFTALKKVQNIYLTHATIPQSSRHIAFSNSTWSTLHKLINSDHMILNSTSIDVKIGKKLRMHSLHPIGFACFTVWCFIPVFFIFYLG